MKNLQYYITEKLKITKDNTFNYLPNNNYELAYKVLDEKLKNAKNGILDMSDVDISNVTSLSTLFAGINDDYPNIHTIDISGWDTSHITDMSEMFANCINVKEIIGIKNLDLKSCRFMGSMFSMCRSLKSLDISNWKPSKQLMDLSYMFDTCSELEELKGIESEIWEDVIANLSSDKLNKMFLNCKKLKLDLRHWYDFKDTTKIVKKCPKIKL